MSGDAFLPLQTPGDLRDGVEILYDEERDAHYFRLPGRGGSEVPPWILTTQKAIPRGTQAMLVRFWCKCDMQYPSEASNQGIGVRLLVITRADNGRSEDSRTLYDSNPEGSFSDRVWYRETHGDVREVTRIIQMPEEVIGGSHVVLQIYARGTGGSADIYEVVEMRNHYSRLFTYKVGAATFADSGDSTPEEYFENYTTGLIGGPAEQRTALCLLKQFQIHKATIPRGRVIRVSGSLSIKEAWLRTANGGLVKCLFGIGVRLKKRDGGETWIAAGAIRTDLDDFAFRDIELAIDKQMIADDTYESVRAAWWFFPLGSGAVRGSVEQLGFQLDVLIDDSEDNV